MANQEQRDTYALAQRIKDLMDTLPRIEGRPAYDALQSAVSELEAVAAYAPRKARTAGLRRAYIYAEYAYKRAPYAYRQTVLDSHAEAVALYQRHAVKQ